MYSFLSIATFVALNLNINLQFQGQMFIWFQFIYIQAIGIKSFEPCIKMDIDDRSPIICYFDLDYFLSQGQMYF